MLQKVFVQGYLQTWFTDCSVTEVNSHTSNVECIYQDLKLFIHIVFENN